MWFGNFTFYTIFDIAFNILGHPTQSSADLGFTAILSIFFFYLGLSSFLFVSYGPSSLYGTQPKPTTCSEVDAI